MTGPTSPTWWGPAAPRARLAVYPGSFDPPTIAHLAVVAAARAHAARVLMVLSAEALGKGPGRTAVTDRAAVLRSEGLEVAVTDARLVADIVAEAGADAVVMGADKWAQVVDPSWYPSPAARDVAVAGLPLVLLAERAGATLAQPARRLVVLDVDPVHAEVSATRARAGEVDLMAPAARASGLWA